MNKIKRIVLISLIGLIGPISSVFAAPARPVTQTITLADGTVVENARLQGDEHFHYWTTPDGQFISADMQRMKQQEVESERQRAQIVGMQHMPNVKNFAPRGLVILADFQDVHFRAENTLAEMDSMLNGDTTRYFTSYGSAKQYFHDQSHGQYTPVFDVIGPVQLPDSLKYYGHNRSNRRGSDDKAPDMVLKACSIASQIDGVDLSLYDNDNDGNLDLVFVIYAGYGESDSGVDTLVWPASWTMTNAVRGGYTSLPTNAPASDFTFQGKKIHYYAYSCELNYFNTIRVPTPGYDDNHPLRAGIGLFCHEFGHVIGLPDYYDTNNGTNYDEFLTPGNWDVMDVGLYNTDGYIPAAYSAHERWWMGWDEPTLLNDSANVTLQADHLSACYITRDGNEALSTTQDTIYYLENRQQTGWDSGVPGHGLLVLRVVFNNSIWSANTPNNTAYKPRYIHIPADGTYTWSRTTGLQGDDGDPFPGSANVTSFTPFPNYPLTDITEENGEISFKFMGGTQGTDLLPEVTAEEKTVAVFSITGAFMGNSLKGLPAGAYIIRKNTGKTEKTILR